MPETVLTPPVDNQPVPPATETPNPNPPAVETPPVDSDWRSSLPEDLRGEKMFENIKGKDAAEVLPTLAKGYRDAQKLVGGSMGKLPAKDAPDAEKQAWRQANLGKLQEAGLIEAAPAEPGKYTAKILKGGEQMSVPEGTYDILYKDFHDLGLTDKQAQGVLDLYSRSQAQVAGSVKDTMDALRQEWGAGTESQIKAAQQAVRHVGGSELLDVLEQTGLGNHPALIKAFAKVGAIIGEDDPIFKDTVRTGDAEARAKRDAIMKDRSHAYWNDGDPGHPAAVAEVARLNQIIFAQEG